MISLVRYMGDDINGYVEEFEESAGAGLTKDRVKALTFPTSSDANVFMFSGGVDPADFSVLSVENCEFWEYQKELVNDLGSVAIDINEVNDGLLLESEIPVMGVGGMTFHKSGKADVIKALVYEFVHEAGGASYEFGFNDDDQLFVRVHREIGGVK